jgi:transcriptional regulator with XRE-family HTH domain
MTIDFSELALSPNESRAARNFLGLSQAQAAEKSNLPVHKLKRFETGNYVPDSQFVQALRDFYEGQGYNFHDKDAPGAKAKARGDVFPGGVVGATDETTEETDGFLKENQPRTQSVNLQFMRIHPDLQHDQIDRILERMEDNEAEVKAGATRPITSGFLSDSPSTLSQAQAIAALRALAENGLLHAKLLGRDVLAPTAAKATSTANGGMQFFFAPATDSRTAAGQTIGELLQAALGDVVRAVMDDDKDAQARLKNRAEPTEVIQALIG